jgi:RNA polymerase sigma factor (sigma-70 family)
MLLENYFSVLNDKEKDIISLVYLKGYTFDEVANMYNVSRQMINTYASRSLKKLKEYASSTV